MTGGYDDGYYACPCFWGREPSSHVKQLTKMLPTLSGLKVLDLGCGEGKNAIYCARMGAQVTAVDVSDQAISNARSIWSVDDYDKITWLIQDASAFDFKDGPFDVIIMYGLCHCLSSLGTVEGLVRNVQANTANGGYNVLCAFNDRKHDLTAHPGFSPLLLQHNVYTDLYSSWHMLAVSDADLFETHPHNNIPHFHSLTRVIACRSD
jgi:tellurite methyltransferase